MISKDLFMMGGKFYCGAHDDRLVCLIPEEHAPTLRTRDHMRSTFYITSFSGCILFQVEDAIKSVLLLPFY